jgi:hypothetical protein
VTVVVMKNCDPLLCYVRRLRYASEGGADVRVGTGIGHGQEERLLMLELEVLVGKLLAIDGLATSALRYVSMSSCLLQFSLYQVCVYSRCRG